MNSIAALTQGHNSRVCWHVQHFAGCSNATNQNFMAAVEQQRVDPSCQANMQRRA